MTSSDSDSDREPNSTGARVFWGNIKTPERSQTNFINPPKTVVKNNQPSQFYPEQQSAKPSTHTQDHTTRTLNHLDQGKRCESPDDERPRSRQLHRNLKDTLDGTEKIIVSKCLNPEHSVDVVGTALNAVDPSSFLQPVFTSQEALPDPGSESEVEGDAVLQPSSPELQMHHFSAECSPPRDPRPPKPQHIVSYGAITPTQLPPHDNPTHLLPMNFAPANQHTPSNIAVDDLIRSPQSFNLQSLSPLNNDQRGRPLQDNHVVSIAPEDHEPSVDLIANVGVHLREGRRVGKDQVIDEANRFLASDDPAMPIPKHVDSHQLNSETDLCSRNTTTTLKGEERTNPGEGSSKKLATSTTKQTGAADDHTTDNAIKKERRAKAKEEVDRKRAQLLSLSPTSVDVLNMLASPDRSGPSGCTASGSLVPELTFDFSTPQRKDSTTPDASLRRLAITQSFKCPEGPPSPSIRPSHPPLDSPTRTPARRIPNMLSPRLRPLPLDHPDRIPARRVAISTPSPSRRMTSIKPPPPLERPHTTLSSMDRSSKLTAATQASNGSTNPFSLDPITSSIVKSLPFPISHQVKKNEKDTGASESSSRPEASSLIAKPPASSLQQHSTSPTKTARVAAKPYLHRLHPRSRLPKFSSRLQISGVNGSNKNADIHRANLPPASTPTRIPSPVKPPLSSIDTREPECAPSSSPIKPNTAKENVTTTYHRKRQRSITEDSDSDEPPAKRPVITLRPVIKGMYNKTLIADPPTSNSLMSQRHGSPIRPARSLGALQIRPAIPGTLSHFDTMSTSSKDAIKHVENHDQADPKSDPATDPSSQRSQSPFMDTSTASTVTTISGEPTSEEISASPAVDGRNVSHPTSIESGPELRRTTRARRHWGTETLSISKSSETTTASRYEPTTPTRTTTIAQQTTTSSKTSSRPSTRHPKPQGYPPNPRQLQALTDANTVHNQAYLADLQTKVVRKEGPRPASPTTKIRTIMERSKEESSREREARAERRRRRGEGSNVTASSDGNYTDTPSSPRQYECQTGVPQKHTRGPGDEEDYETPLREPKPSRLDPERIAKNVKWDRGLARTISEWTAEQAVKQVQGSDSEDVIKKGCLARDPMTLNLDSWGNVPEANTPLDDLGRERIIVTRFIYDDDVEANRMAKKKKS